MTYFFNKNKSEQSELCSDVVRVKGLEPSRPGAPEPKSGASANSAIPAQHVRIIPEILFNVKIFLIPPHAHITYAARTIVIRRPCRISTAL